MRLQCPHCQRVIDIVEPDTALQTDDGFVEGSSVVTCPLCGSQLPQFTSTISFTGVVPQRIGPFELRERLGQGQFGVVWMARDTGLDRIVALKLPRNIEIMEKGEELFRKEARAVAALDHPNIVRLYEVRKEADQLVIVTEYVPGVTLQTKLKNSSYKFEDSAVLCQQLAEALHHAHERGIVHRDIKPSNILINPQGVPKLADFGLAKRDAAEITMTLDGHILGTPAYMPPEQARGHSHSADRRSDVYSLGVVLYEMLTGRRPFQGSTRDLLDQVISSDPRAPRRLDKKIPRDLETICLTAMSKEPARRYQTAAAFAADLQRFRNGEAIIARPHGVIEKCWKWSRRHPWQTATAVFATLTVTLMIGMSQGSPRPAPSVPSAPSAPSAHLEPSLEMRSFVLDTKPTGAQLVFYRLDPKTGEPLSETAIRPAERSKLNLKLPTGDYLVVATLSDGRFHEVYRRVPGSGAGMAKSYPHQNWRNVEDNQIELPEIVIPDLDVTRGMAEFSGNSRFLMGLATDPLIPIHSKSIPPFYLDVHELTIAEFRAKKGLPAAWSDKEVVPDESLAVTRVFFDEAVQFAEESGKRLMTEAEYEFAATLGGKRIYPWGDTAPPADWPIDSIDKATSDQLPTTPRVKGLFSNVGEFTSSWANPYPGHTTVGLEQVEIVRSLRIVRGTPPWILNPDAPHGQRAFTPRHRISVYINALSRNVGFRMARSRRPRLSEDDFERLMGE